MTKIKINKQVLAPAKTDKMTKSLFSNSIEDEKFSINKDFASKYEEKKRHEEMSKLEEKYKGVKEKQDSKDDEDEDDDDESDSESDEDEDEVGELVTPAVDLQILKTLSALKRKDPLIYDPSHKYFDQEELTKKEKQFLLKKRGDKQERHTPIHLKDYHRERILSGAVSANNDNDDSEKKPSKTPRAAEFLLMKDGEQRGILDDFKKAAQSVVGVEEDEDFSLKIKPNETGESYKNFVLQNIDSPSAAAIFSATNDSNPEQNFLMDYILNKGWVDEKKIVSGSSSIGGGCYNNNGNATTNKNFAINGISDDEETIEEEEKFEEKYNFRFEQPGSASIVTYPRQITNSLRLKDDRRKMGREAKALRKEEERRKEKEDLKRLKNLKRSELKERLKKIGRISNLKKVPKALVDDGDDDGEFDPEKHDRMMQEMFNDNYYNVKEGDEDIVDCDDGLDNDLKEVSRRISTIKEEEEEEERKIKEIDIEKELLSLDYEDKIGDNVKCRFRYQSVKPTTFGLSVREIMEAEEAELNAHVGVKRIAAPYRSDAVFEKDQDRYASKKRVCKFRDLLKRRIEGNK